MALPTDIELAARTTRERLEGTFPGRVRRVVVFGSTARGEAHEESDVDLLVLLDRLEPRERARAMDVAGEVALALTLPLVPLVLSQAEWDDLVRRERLLPGEVARDGVDV